MCNPRDRTYFLEPRMLGFLKWDANHDNHGDSKHELFKDSNDNRVSLPTRMEAIITYYLSIWKKGT